MLISVINGVTRMTGKGVCPSNEFLESVVKTTYTNVSDLWAVACVCVSVRVYLTPRYDRDLCVRNHS